MLSSDSDDHNISMCISRMDYSEEEDEEEEEYEFDFSELSCINNNFERGVTIFMILRTEKKINMYRKTYSYADIMKLTPLFNNVDIFTRLFDSMYDIDEYIVSYKHIKNSLLEINFNIKLNDLIDETFTLNLSYSRGIDIEKHFSDSEYEIGDY